MANPFVHVELNTQDVTKAKKLFDQSLFAWSLNDVDMGRRYYGMIIDVGEGTGGGGDPDAGRRRCGCRNVLADDIVAATAKAKSLGATIVRERDGGAGRRFALSHHRSHRRHAGLVAAQCKIAASENYPRRRLCKAGPPRNIQA